MTNPLASATATDTGSWRLRARTQFVAVPAPGGGIAKVILRLGERTGRIEPFDSAAERLLRELAAGGTAHDVLDRVVADLGPATRDRVAALLDDLLDGGFCEQVVPPADGLVPADLARFSRLVDFFSEFETDEASRYEFMTRLRNARVAVVGTGGMGSWLIYNLACCGVGRLRLIDGDVVEPSNLNRAILYTEDDIGVPKVHAAARSIRRFAPRTEIETLEMFVTGADGLRDVLQDVDLLVCCADKPTWLLRRWVAEAALATGTPALCASGLRIGPFYIPGRSSCPMCEWATLVEREPKLPAMLSAQSRLPSGNSGSLAPLGAMTAAILGWDALRYISGYAEPRSLNGVWQMDANVSSVVLPVPAHPRCEVCAGSA
jgi:hypothetical protein